MFSKIFKIEQNFICPCEGDTYDQVIKFEVSIVKTSVGLVFTKFGFHTGIK